MDGMSGIDGDGDGTGAGIVSGAWGDEGEGGRARIGDWGGTTWAGELCTLLIVLMVRL